MIWLPSTSSAVTPPEEVVHSELVARSVHTSKGFKKAKSEGERDKVTALAFDPPKDREDRTKRIRKLSVDRCQYLSESQAAALACERGKNRGLGFHGWAMITADNARKCGTQVVSSPAVDQDNPAHADILIPAQEVNDDEARNRRLLQLAAASCWQGAPVS